MFCRLEGATRTLFPSSVLQADLPQAVLTAVLWLDPGVSQFDWMRQARAFGQLVRMQPLFDPSMLGEYVFTERRFLADLAAWAEGGCEGAAPQFAAYGLPRELPPSMPADEEPVMTAMLPSLGPQLLELCGPVGPGNRYPALCGIKGNTTMVDPAAVPAVVVLQTAEGAEQQRLECLVSLGCPVQLISRSAMSAAERQQAPVPLQEVGGIPAWGSCRWSCLVLLATGACLGHLIASFCPSADHPPSPPRPRCCSCCWSTAT